MCLKYGNPQKLNTPHPSSFARENKKTIIRAIALEGEVAGCRASVEGCRVHLLIGMLVNGGGGGVDGVGVGDGDGVGVGVGVGAGAGVGVGVGEPPAQWHMAGIYR